MKRRNFFKALGGLVIAPVAAKADTPAKYAARWKETFYEGTPHETKIPVTRIFPTREAAEAFSNDVTKVPQWSEPAIVRIMKDRA